MSGERGQASIEWVAVLLLVGALVLGGAIVAVPVVAQQIASMLGVDRGPADPAGAYDVAERGAARRWQAILDARLAVDARLDALEAVGDAHYEIGDALFSRLPVDPDVPYADVVSIDGLGALPALYRTRLRAMALAFRARTYDMTDAIEREANAALRDGYGPELRALVELKTTDPERSAEYEARRLRLIDRINDTANLRDGIGRRARATRLRRPRDRAHVMPEAAAAEAAYGAARATFLADLDAYAPTERDLVARLTAVANGPEAAQLARLDQLDGADRARFLTSLVARLGTVEERQLVSRAVDADPRIVVRQKAERAVEVRDGVGRVLAQADLGLARSIARAYRLGTDPKVAKKDADAALGEPITLAVARFGPAWMAIPVRATMALGAPDLIAGLGKLSRSVAAADRMLRPLDTSVPQPVPTLQALGLPPYASLDDPLLP